MGEEWRGAARTVTRSPLWENAPGARRALSLLCGGRAVLEGALPGGPLGPWAAAPACARREQPVGLEPEGRPLREVPEGVGVAIERPPEGQHRTDRREMAGSTSPADTCGLWAIAGHEARGGQTHPVSALGTAGGLLSERVCAGGNVTAGVTAQGKRSERRAPKSLRAPWICA